MLRALLLFAAAYTLGEGARRLLHLPVPGAARGMMLLFLLFVRRGMPAAVERTGRRVLYLLPLFFVPPGVAAVEHATLIVRYWPAIVAALTGSSVAALLVTGFALLAFERNEAAGRANLAAREQE